MSLFFFVASFLLWSCLVYAVIEKNDNGDGDIWWGMFAVWLIGNGLIVAGFKLLL